MTDETRTLGSITRAYTLHCTCGTSSPIQGAKDLTTATRTAQKVMAWRYRLGRGWTCPSCDRCSPEASCGSTNENTLDTPNEAPTSTPHTPGAIPNGIWTYHSTAGHRTVQIETQPQDASFAPGKRTISLLVAPEDYQGFGFISGDARKITVWGRKRGEGGAPSDYEKTANILTAMFVRGQRMFQGETYHLLGEATCLRCSRRLTTPESILAGYGPTCRERA